jgi:tetratricopeptide (TPR) repeat protein
MQARIGGDVGWYHARLGNYAQARDHCHAALILHRRHRDREAVAATLDSLGYIAHHAGHHAQALGYYREALDLFRGLGDTYREAEILSCLAQAHGALGECGEARDAWRRALELHESQQRPADAERIRHHLSSS